MGYSDEESLLYNIAELYKSSWQFHKATTYVKTLNKLYPGNFRLRMLESLLYDDMRFYGKNMLVLRPKLRICRHSAHLSWSDIYNFICASADC